MIIRYNINIKKNVITKFVNELYDIRQKAKGMIKAVTKLILNSPFGRFGMNIHKSEFKIVDKDTLDLLLSTRIVRALKELNDNTFIVSFDSNISKSVCNNSGLD